MKTNHAICFLFLLAIVVVSSCKETTNNWVFEKTNPTSAIYKTELAKQLKTRQADDLTYTLKDYKVVSGKAYLELNIKDDGLDAEGLFAVTNWKNLEGIRNNKGVGYRHAELKGVKIAVINNNLELQSVDRIID